LKNGYLPIGLAQVNTWIRQSKTVKNKIRLSTNCNNMPYIDSIVVSF